MRIAILADIHGNLLALQAALADIGRRGIAQVIHLGDCVSGPLWPRETLELLQATGIASVRGNHDRWVAEGVTGGADAYARQQLDAAQIAWLHALPFSLRPQPGLLAFHARPDDDNAYLLEDVRDGRLAEAAPEDVAARLGDAAAGLVLCGHSHRAGLLALPDGRLVLNPGSLGCPAYADPTPPAHVSEAGSAFARYAIVTLAEGAVATAELVALAYDHAGAAARAAALGRSDWAQALRHGRMPKA